MAAAIDTSGTQKIELVIVDTEQSADKADKSGLLTDLYLKSQVPDWAATALSAVQVQDSLWRAIVGKDLADSARAGPAKLYEKPLRIVCVREHKTALRKSAKPAIEDAIREP